MSGKQLAAIVLSSTIFASALALIATATMASNEVDEQAIVKSILKSVPH